jgi:hypothetical protein
MSSSNLASLGKPYVLPKLREHHYHSWIKDRINVLGRITKIENNRGESNESPHTSDSQRIRYLAQYVIDQQACYSINWRGTKRELREDSVRDAIRVEREVVLCEIALIEEVLTHSQKQEISYLLVDSVVEEVHIQKDRFLEKTAKDAIVEAQKSCVQKKYKKLPLNDVTLEQKNRISMHIQQVITGIEKVLKEGVNFKGQIQNPDAQERFSHYRNLVLSAQASSIVGALS